MNVNFYVTCIADIIKSNVAKNSVLLLEKLGCNVIFLEKQGCCGQPAINSGYAKDAVAGMKKLVETFEVNDYPIVAPAGSCVYAIKRFNRFYCECFRQNQRGGMLNRQSRLSPILQLNS